MDDKLNKLKMIKSKTAKLDSLDTVIQFDNPLEAELLLKVQKNIEGLYELINSQEDYDFDKLFLQLKALEERLDFTDALKAIEKAVKDSRVEPPKPFKQISVDNLGELVKATK